MLNLVPDTQSDVIKAFNNTSRYLDDILNIDNPFIASLVNTIYPKELQLNKANKGDTTASFLDLHRSLENGRIISKFMIREMILILIL